MYLFLKSIIKLFIPVIFTKRGIWKFRRLINDKIGNSKKILFEKNFYNRISFIQKAISNFDQKSCYYLEIGTYQTIGQYRQRHQKTWPFPMVTLWL